MKELRLRSGLRAKSSAIAMMKRMSVSGVLGIRTFSLCLQGAALGAQENLRRMALPIRAFVEA